MALLVAGRRSKELSSKEIGQRWTYLLSSSSGKIMRLAFLKVEISVKEVLFICSDSRAWTGTSGGVEGSKNWPCWSGMEIHGKKRGSALITDQGVKNGVIATSCSLPLEGLLDPYLWLMEWMNWLGCIEERMAGDMRWYSWNFHVERAWEPRVRGKSNFLMKWYNKAVVHLQLSDLKELEVLGPRGEAEENVKDGDFVPVLVFTVFTLVVGASSAGRAWRISIGSAAGWAWWRSVACAAPPAYLRLFIFRFGNLTVCHSWMRNLGSIEAGCELGGEGDGGRGVGL
ncbi:hypothetical protein FXO37_11784 [Capsicum annuum]|nr:hypothetical protein FXO37_11784 [Capsicum annuum]